MKFHITDGVARLERLLSDFRRLVSGDISGAELMAVPTLNNWVATTRTVQCLGGEVEGHPSFVDGHPVVTSEILAFFQDDGEYFARTQNRWYRLGAAGRSVEAR